MKEHYINAYIHKYINELYQATYVSCCCLTLFISVLM
jgi:hypothetical protein